MIKPHYNTLTGMVHVPDDASLYARFHEEAHREQHETQALPFRVWWRTGWIRGVRYFVLLWIEWDAYRRARMRLERLGLWNDDFEKEARQSLKSYVTRQELT